MLQHTHDLIAVAELVIVPGDQLDKVLIQHDAGGFVENAGAGIADHIGGNHLVGGIGDDALHVGFAGVTDGIADVSVGSRGAQTGGQIHHGHIGGGNAEGHAGHLAHQAGNHAAHGLGSAGGGGNDVVQDGTAGAPVAAAAGVNRLLLGGGGVDGGHQALLDAKLIIDDLGQRCQTVCGAACVGDDLHIGAVFIAVDAVNEGGGGLILAGSRQDDLLGAAPEVTGGLFGGVIGAGGFNDVLCAAGAPGNQRRVRLAEDLDLVAVEHQIAADMLHRSVKVTKYGVILDLIDHVVDVCLAQVDAANIKLLRIFRQDAQDNAADASKTIDTDFDCHNFAFLSPSHILCGLRQ